MKYFNGDASYKSLETSGLGSYLFYILTSL